MHHVDNLVISCIDFRFRGRTAQWIDEQLNGESDLVAIAGASKALLEESLQKVVLNQIHLAKDLHGITTVHIIDHLDCGAYGGASAFNSEEDEIIAHTEKLQAAAAVIAEHVPGVRLSLYIMDPFVVREITH